MLAKSNNKKITLTIVMILLGASVYMLNAQDKKSIKEKLLEIKGDAKSITIETSEGNFNFKGEEAKDLLKMLKQKRIVELEKNISFLPDSDEADVFVMRHGNLPKRDMIGIEAEANDDDKEVSVLKKDGKTTVTIKTKVDGKEETKVLTGEEAEDFLKKENQQIRVKKLRRPRMMDRGCCSCRMPREEVEFFGDEIPLDDFDWMDISDNKEMKKVVIKEEDGQKTIAVESVIDGEKKKETFKGKAAEEYLKKMEAEDKLKIDEKADGNKKVKKIILKK